MTRAVLLALVGGACAAGALAELAGAARGLGRARRRGGRWPALLARLGRRIGVLPAPGDLAARIAAAGEPLGLAPGDVMATKAGAALVAPLAALPLAATAPGRSGIVLLGCAAAGGYLGPDLWLRRRAARRARAMERELADVLDLLRVCVQAGLPTTRALAEVGARHAGVLAAELRALAATVDLGVPRAAALERLAARAPLAAVAALVAAIGRSDRHGAPLAPALTALAADARAERGRRLAEQAAKAAPKIQLVVALLLVPAVMLLVAAAVLHALGLAAA
jgi:tight adherence protein C